MQWVCPSPMWQYHVYRLFFPDWVLLIVLVLAVALIARRR